MYSIFKNEIYKMITPLKLISIVFGIFVIVGLISTVEYFGMFKLVNDNFFDVFMKFNLSFIVMNFILPIGMILFTSYSFAEEYDSGIIKSYLLCGINRKDLYLGKLMYLNFLLIFISIIIYFSLVITCILLDNKMYIGMNIFEYLPIYICAAVASEVTILVTILFSLILENNNKTILASITIMTLCLVVDNTFEKIFYTTTSFLSNIILFYERNVGQYKPLVLVFLVYLIGLNIINLLFFKNKDIWR